MTVRWYAVMTKPRGEYGLHRDLQAQGYRTLWLHYAGTIRHARRVIGVQKPYLPRYLPVAVTLGQSLGPVREHRLTASIVHTSDGPLEIPASVIEELASRGDESGKIADLAPGQRRRIEEGTEVRILQGPFRGFLATVALDRGRQITLWLSVFGRPTETTVDPSEVERVSPGVGRRGPDIPEINRRLSSDRAISGSRAGRLIRP